MTTIRNGLFLVLVSFGMSPVAADPPEKPRTRETAEDKQTNLSRYVIGGHEQDATASLGIEVIYSQAPPKVTVSSFKFESPAEAAGLEEYDWILEIDGSAVGKFRDRYYQPWQKYGRSGKGQTELLVSFNTTGGRKYYYPKVKTQALGGEGGFVPKGDAFTITKPRTRSGAEGKKDNLARYVLDSDNFKKYSPYELGADVAYSYNNGATIAHITPGKPASEAGLRVGDYILEVDGAPIGVFGDRVYEVWRQYKYSKDNIVEFLVCFRDARGHLRYYYPLVTLKKLTSSN